MKGPLLAVAVALAVVGAAGAAYAYNRRKKRTADEQLVRDYVADPNAQASDPLVVQRAQERQREVTNEAARADMFAQVSDRALVRYMNAWTPMLGPTITACRPRHDGEDVCRYKRMPWDPNLEGGCSAKRTVRIRGFKAGGLTFFYSRDCAALNGLESQNPNIAIFATSKEQAKWTAYNWRTKRFVRPNSLRFKFGETPSITLAACSFHWMYLPQRFRGTSNRDEHRYVMDSSVMDLIKSFAYWSPRGWPMEG